MVPFPDRAIEVTEGKSKYLFWNEINVSVRVTYH